MLLALGLFQQTRRQKRFGGSQVPSSLALCSRLPLFEFLLRLGLPLNFRLGLTFLDRVLFRSQTRRQKRFGGSQVPSSLALCSRLQLFEFLLRLGLRLNFRLGLRFRRGLGVSFVLLLQKLCHALLKRHQITRNAPRHLLPIRGEFNAADQVWRGLEPDANFSRERFVERILYGRALLRRHVKRAAHNRRVGGCLKGRAEAFFRLAVHLSQAASEHLAQAFFQTRRGEIRQRLSSDRKHFLLGPAADGLI